MTRSARQITGTGLVVGLLLVGGLAGCTTSGKAVLPPSLESTLAAGATVEDYVTAARLYGREAGTLAAAANSLEQRADLYRARPYLDPKGLKRASLLRLSGTYRQQASEMQQQYALYNAKARSVITQEAGRQGEPSGS